MAHFMQVDGLAGTTIGPRTLVDAAHHPGWTWSFVRSDPIRFANVVGRDVADGSPPVSLSDYITTQFDPALSWAASSERGPLPSSTALSSSAAGTPDRPSGARRTTCT
jgi:hypothetical protein